jgi:hypothetical protein
MSHFAQVKNNLVEQVIVADKEDWVQTSYNTHQNQHTLGGNPLRGNYAGVGYHYDTTNDVFYAPQPYPSWVLNTSIWSWEAPVPYPTDGKPYYWDEQTQSWLGTNNGS